jgi:hypothetical protein
MFIEMSLLKDSFLRQSEKLALTNECVVEGHSRKHLVPTHYRTERGLGSSAGQPRWGSGCAGS